MPRATFLQRPGKREGSRFSMKDMIRKLIEKHLISGWGKRQLLKLGIAIAPVLAVSNDLPGAVQAFAALKPEQPKPEKTEE